MNTVLQTIPRLSAEIFVVPTEDTENPDSYLVYAPLRRSAFVAHSNVVNFIADLGEGYYDTDFDADGRLSRWLRALGILDGNPESRPEIRSEGPPEPTGVTLFLTTGCNLRCTYCYASAGDTPVRHMSIEVARQGIDFVSDNALRKGLDHFQLAFHGGGEPTLNWKVLTGAYDYAQARARQLNLECTVSSATNGMLNDTQIDWLIEHLDSVSLSLDGDPEAQDRHRPTVKGQGSSKRVLHTIDRFDRCDFAYGIRMTVTADQIARLPTSVEFICRNANPRAIQIEPAYRMGRWSDAPSAETNQFIESYREARQLARSYGKELVFSAARVGMLTNHFCGVSQDSFSLSPDGNVSACFEVFSESSRHADRFFYGTPDETGGYQFDMHSLERLRDLSVEHKPFCQGCFAKWHCAGDCHHNSLDFGSTAKFAGSDRCHITRALTRDQVLERISNSGGLAWCDQNPDVASGVFDREASYDHS